jgi:hypothetical protein
MRISIPLDLSSRTFIPLLCFIRSRRPLHFQLLPSFLLLDVLSKRYMRGFYQEFYRVFLPLIVLVWHFWPSVFTLFYSVANKHTFPLHPTVMLCSICRRFMFYFSLLSSLDGENVFCNPLYITTVHSNRPELVTRYSYFPTKTRPGLLVVSYNDKRWSKAGGRPSLQWGLSGLDMSSSTENLRPR